MSDLFRKPVKESERFNRYEILGFRYNPFPVDPTVKPYSNDERENGTIYIPELRTEEINTFRKVVVHGDSKICLLMDYAAYRGRGIGKTAFLNYLRKEINKDLGLEYTDGQKVIYSIYVSPGGEKRERKFNHLSRLIFEAIINDGLLLIAISRLRAQTGLIPENVLKLVTYENIQDTIGDEQWLRKNGVDVNQVNLEVTKILKRNGVEYVGGRVAPNLFEEFGVYMSKQDLVAQSETRWAKFGPDFVFSELVRIFHAAEISNIIILFDEAEKIIISQNFGERRELCDNLRYYFIDGNNENAVLGFFKILMTIHPNSQELLLTHWNAAGLERFSALGDDANSNTIFFRPLKEKRFAILLASAYINHSRIEKRGGVDDLQPFSESSLIRAFDLCEGIPGKYLKLLYSTIEHAVSQNWSEISVEKIDGLWKRIVDIEVSGKVDLEELAKTKTNLK